MKKTLKSLKGKKLKSTDLISLKGGRQVPVTTFNFTVRDCMMYNDGDTQDP
jgi:hypothetical protein